MSREKNLIKNTFILSIGTFLPKLASFITLPILTAYLTKDEYGRYDLITVLASLLLPAVTLQIQTAAFRFLVDERKNNHNIIEIVSTIFVFVVPISIASLIFLWIFLPLNDSFIKFTICLYFFADILVNATRQIARGLNQNKDYAISAIISATGKMIFAVILVWKLKWGLLGAVISLCSASWLSFVVLSYRMDLIKIIDTHAISIDRLKSLLSYSWPMIPNSLSMWVMRLSDRLIVTCFMGLSWAGIYGVANKIPALLDLAQNAFTMAWQENASIASRDKDASLYYSKMFRTMYDLTSGFLGILICLTPLLFKLFIRGDYNEAYVQIPILMFAEFFFSISTFLGGIYVAFMKTKSVGFTTMTAAACNLIIDFVLVNIIGLFAASISTLVSYIVLFVYRLIDVQKIVKIKFDWKHMIIVMIIVIIEIAFCILRINVMNYINIIIGFSLFFWLNNKLIFQVFPKLKKRNNE